MYHDLAYYRSLSSTEIISLPIEQYKEYLSFLVEESNRNFHECLNALKNENSGYDLSTSESNSFIDSTDEDSVYRFSLRMDFGDLLEEYTASRVIQRYLLSGSDVLANSFASVYISSLVPIFERAICERLVCNCSVCDMLAGAGLPGCCASGGARPL